jgi:hypothetical protein
MSAVRKVKRAPTFTTSEYVDVEVDPEDLEAAGWVYVGKQGDGVTASSGTVLDVVRAWHDEIHDIALVSERALPLVEPRAGG